MKKTPAILMTTALLSVPCTEGTAQKTTATNPIVIPSITRSIQEQFPTPYRFKELVAQHSNRDVTPSDITFSMNFVDDLGYDSFDFEVLLISIEYEFFDDILSSPISSGTSFHLLTVRDLWEHVESEWDRLYGGGASDEEDC